jgi:hypothetical protein
LAGNQLLDTKFINCSNPVNPGLTGFEQMTKILSSNQISSSSPPLVKSSIMIYFRSNLQF